MVCKFCNKECKNRNSLSQHEIRCKNNPDGIKPSGGFSSYNEMKKTGKIVNVYTNQYTKSKILGLPKPIIAEETRRKMSESCKGRLHSKEIKNKISESMKAAHLEKRAWNIGKSRWNNKPSYPELFFIDVINNEFNNKNYTREFSVGIYSIDFAWIDLKLAIEIDGEQHERFEEYRERDKRKDLVLYKNGWKILRIKWKDIFKNPKKWINISKNFIEGIN